MDELELTEIECDAVLLDDDAWNAKYTPPEPAPEEPADPYGWMHTCLARLLPESMQSNEKLWNGTTSALKAADVRSEEQDAMSSEDLKMANVPFIARHHLVKKRKGEEGAEDRPSGRSPQSGLNTPAWRHDSAATTHSQTPLEKSSTSLSVPSTASTPNFVSVRTIKGSSSAPRRRAREARRRTVRHSSMMHRWGRASRRSLSGRTERARR
jgi:hypothetical protein